MSLEQSASTAPMILEPVPIPDTFVTNISVDDCGDHVRVVGYSDRTVHGSVERTIVLRAVLTQRDFATAVATAFKAIRMASH